MVKILGYVCVPQETSGRQFDINKLVFRINSSIQFAHKAVSLILLHQSKPLVVLSSFANMQQSDFKYLRYSMLLHVLIKI